MGAEVLARMTAKTQNFSGVAGGGVGGMSASDWAALCSLHGMRGAVERYGWLKYTEHLTLDRMLACSLTYPARGSSGLRMRIQRLAADAIALGVGMAERQGWRDRLDEPKLIRFCELALAESVCPPNCGACAGLGVVSSRSVRVECKSCHGSGKGEMREAERAVLIGVSPSAWCHSWKARYYDLKGRINDWDAEVWRVLGRERRE